MDLINGWMLNRFYCCIVLLLNRGTVGSCLLLNRRIVGLSNRHCEEAKRGFR